MIADKVSYESAKTSFETELNNYRTAYAAWEPYRNGLTGARTLKSNEYITTNRSSSIASQV